MVNGTQDYNKSALMTIDQQASTQIFSTPRRFIFIALMVVTAFLFMQHKSVTAVVVHLNLPDNDDLTRLLSVRDLLAGQAWFDMTQYNFVSPEGLSLHWSRYVDAGLIGLQWVLAIFLGPADAERWGTVIWPICLFFVFVAISASTITRLFGWQAASFTLLPLITMAVFPFGYFAIGRIDHHNLQMVLMLASAVLLTKDQRPIQTGALSGGVAALSLAVGLESLVFFLVAGVFLLGQAVLGVQRGREQFLGFGLGLGIFAPLFYVGQVPYEKWMQHYCDALSPPILWATSVAFLFSLLFYGISGYTKTTLQRGCLAFALATASIILLWPQLAACAKGPYGQLPDDLRRLALGRIFEAQPVIEVLGGINNYLLPSLVTLVAAIYSLTKVSALTDDRVALKAGWLFVALLAITTAGLMVQARFAVLVFVVMPLVFGFTVSTLLRFSLDGSGWIRVMFLGCLLLTVLLNMPLSVVTQRLSVFVDNIGTANQEVNGVSANAAGKRKGLDSHCRTSELIKDLNKIPSGRVLSSINLGPAIALHTHHTALSAPYHRSVVAMENGFHVMGLPEEAFLDALQTVNTDLLLVCQGSNYGSNAITSDLAAGHTRDWAEPVPSVEGPLQLFHIRPDVAPK